jgi:putative hydrolase of the HAD superfamily
MKNLNNVDFLLFDLGFVIIHIDYAFSINELKKNLPAEKWNLASDLYSTPFHKDFERGALDANEFREHVREFFGMPWSDELIDRLWNSLLIEFPPERVKLIKDLGKKYRTGILSNTNSIHMEAVNKMLQRDTKESDIADIVDHVFLSHEMGLSKPGVDIYKKVISEIGVDAEKVLFFDDVEENLIGAKEVGLQTFHVNKTDALIRFFQDVQ